MKRLYDAAAENRDLIEARCQPEDGGAILEGYRRKIVEQFFPARGEGKLKLGEVRKAIRDYRRATRDVPGTAELLMTYVENGTRFTHEYGDIDERFYNSGETALDEREPAFLRRTHWPGRRAWRRPPPPPRSLTGFGWRSPRATSFRPRASSPAAALGRCGLPAPRGRHSGRGYCDPRLTKPPY